MLSNRNLLYYIRIIIDLVVLTISYAAAYLITIVHNNIGLTYNETIPLFMLLLVWFLTAKSYSLYDEFRIRTFISELIALIKNIIVQTIALIILLFLLRQGELSRFFVLIYIFILTLFIILEKYIINKYIKKVRIKGRNIRYMLIIGAGELGKKFYSTIKSHPHFGYRVIGFLDDDPSTMSNGMYLGSIEDLTKRLNEHPVDDVIIALPTRATEKMSGIVKTCEQYATKVRIIPDYFSMISSKFSFSIFDTFPIITVREDRLSQIQWRILKRGFDQSLTIFLFIFVFSWLWPIIALSIKLTSKGPVLYKQERGGRGYHPFTLYKFRSMVVESKDTDENGKYQQATKKDPRVTKVGAFLRKTNLDELPQFINVLKGEMSIVGPRPHPILLDNESRKEIDFYLQRNLVKPGITGWAQVNGLRGETSEQGLMQKRVTHDLWYIENWTFWLDIQIIFLTTWNMIKGDKNAY